jgi:hypothetical protein
MMVNTNELIFFFYKYNGMNSIQINENTLLVDFRLLLLFCLVFFMFRFHMYERMFYVCVIALILELLLGLLKSARKCTII